MRGYQIYKFPGLRSIDTDYRLLVPTGFEYSVNTVLIAKIVDGKLLTNLRKGIGT